MRVISRDAIARNVLVLVLLLLLTACAGVPYKYEPLQTFGIESRAVTQQKGPFTIRASVPSDTEAEKLFGIQLSKRNIQAVWMEITNDSDTRARFAPYSVDPAYFPPHEVAYMYRKQFSKQGWKDMENRFFSDSLPRYIGGGETVSGFVFTNATTGTKAFNVDIFSFVKTIVYEHFTFFVDVPGFKPDHAEVDFKNIYNVNEYKDLDVITFREYVAALPCCTANSDSSGQGQPIMLLFVSSGQGLLRGLLRAGWKESSYQRDDSFLNATDYYFGRPPDAIFRKQRDKTTERNEMGLWLTPVSVGGEAVWAAQVKHAIGRRYEIGEMFFGIRQDPDVDDGRNYVLQDMWYSQALKQYAWTISGTKMSKTEPAIDFNDNAWFSDGLRLVLWVSGEPVSLQETRILDWEDLSDFKWGPE